ncbi:hypothetical protein ACUOCP_47750, partial [Escherichia sp. R-CC3]
TGYFGWVQDTHVDHVAVFFGCCVVTVVAVAAFNGVSNNRRFFAAATEEYGNMIDMGILDPTKVTRSALQYAASVAGLMITTECMVTDLPKNDAADLGAAGGM